jgi:two-component system response regulator DesR
MHMITVAIAEDMHLVRGALVALLELENDIAIVAEVESGQLALEAVRHHRPMVAILDVDMPGLDGISAARLIRAELPDVRLLMLTAIARPGTLQRALAAGVDGYLLKDAPPDELAAAIRAVARGGRVLSTELALSAWDLGESPLSQRELDVLRAAAAGAEVDDIARDLFLSSGTVRNYLSNAVTKLQANNRVDAIRIATAAGWL